MDSTSAKLVTYNIRQQHRFEAKKRKVEALLNLFENDKSPIPKKKKNEGDSLGKSYKALKDQLKKFMKKPEVEPVLYLTELGLKALVDFKTFKKNGAKKSTPLCFEDIYQFLLKSVVGHLSPESLHWAKLEQPQNICRTVVLVVSGLSSKDISRNVGSLNAVSENFSSILKIISPNVSFATELGTVHQMTDFHINSQDAYTTIFPKEKDVKVEPVRNDNIPSKLHLLLSPIQLVMENYPLPQSVFQYSKSRNYVFSKSEYSSVTADSPMFAVDCEMCRTETGENELARVAIVSENLEIVYETLVKPKARIVDYMTRYSGITKAMLTNVNVSLSNVQHQMQMLLPPDAILCGQSLNCDLHALKMIHPYVIDTSIIFNGRGIRGKKDSLKYLAMAHLNEQIQHGKKGHHPIEDAIATMKLVKLKLENPIHFGDACLVGLSGAISDPSNDVTPKTLDVKETEDNNAAVKEGFFQAISKFDKKVCLVGSKDTLDVYVPEILTENVQKKVKSDIKKIVKTTSKHMKEFHLTISHLDFGLKELSESVEDLNNILAELFDSCEDRTMFTVYISGVNEAKFEDVKNGLFMAAIKNSK